jgi:peptidyl-prolyl cis-trans isomerase D
MSIIQSIRDKYARWAVVAIAVSLLGFILMDAMSSRTGGLFSGGRGKTLGSVNGQKIDAETFAKKVELQEQRMNAQSNGANVDELTRQRLTEQLWNQEVEVAVMNTEFQKLGMSVGKKELNDIILNNPTEDLRRNGTNEQGVYDGVAVQQSIKEQLKKGTAEQKKSINEFIDGLEYSRMSEKYNGMLTGSIYYPKWFVEKENANRSAMAKISYVAVPYTAVSDSAVRITDKEIQDYIDKNKDLFKQKEGRNISYVSFAATPISGDSAAVRKDVLDKKVEFIADTNAAQYLTRVGSQIKFYDNYVGKSQMQMPMKDSIQRLGKNQAFGPYLDFGQAGSNYVIAKMLDMKTLPDSLKARHILVQTADQQGRLVLEDSVAEKRIDSIIAAINKGARFDSMAVKLSDDKGSGAKGGLLATEQSDYFPQGQMVKEFNDFCSEGNIGERKKVKTQFGYHYIEILDKKNPQPYYKVAYLAKPIVASDETETNTENAANSFAGNSRTLDTFTANVEKDLKPKGLNSLVVNDISPIAYSLPQLGGNVNCRQFVKAVYEADKGKVLQPMRVGDNFIVAVVTAVNKEGIMSAATARMQVEPLLRNKKKAEEIKKKIGAVTTPEALASSMSLQVQTLDSVRFDIGAPGGLGSEQKVIGAAFNAANKGKVVPQPLDGLMGVYVVRVDDVTATSAAAGTVEEQQKMMIMQTRMRAMQALNPQMQMYGGGGPTPADILKQAAKIKDNRADFY